ncbi:DUF934 domain-containing protein [uncultured Rhodoblastus sp.]|uniref:DUF934 domain-containing protein n=1 Tax=uncultured Rhodoblastus sp. TaxID=543037 RepID=UPI0025F7E6AE|nr:DUF934 domain-containing protein [uncultured Rhodoblastus sp.]
MLLLDRRGAKEETFTRIESAGESGGGSILAPFALIEEILAQHGDNRRIGVLVSNNVTADALEPYFDRLALIAVVFPSGTDGRGFSLARQIRRRGFRGILRASGPLFSDQFPQALACGFHEVEIPDANAARQPVEQWLAAANRVSLAYQRTHGAGENILDLRRRARLDGEAKDV